MAAAGSLIIDLSAGFRNDLWLPLKYCIYTKHTEYF